MKIYKYFRSEIYKSITIFHIPVWKMQVDKNYISFYLFGIKIYKKEKISNGEVLIQLKNLFFNNQVLNQVPYYHNSIFPKYQCIYEGQDVVIVASGPTANDYIPIPNAIHIAINGAVNLNKIKFQYVFLTDLLRANPGINDIIDSYLGSNCTKFYAILPYNRDKIMRRCSDNSGRIPQNRFYNANAIPFLLEDVFANKWAVNLACEPFGDFGGSVFSALQFALYTHPKRIFLVGCDCSSGYCYNTPYKGDNSSKIKSFKLFKNFSSQVYPDVEIYSINPQKLEGLFRDIYINEEKQYITKTGRALDLSKEIIL